MYEIPIFLSLASYIWKSIVVHSLNKKKPFTFSSIFDVSSMDRADEGPERTLSNSTCCENDTLGNPLQNRQELVRILHDNGVLDGVIDPVRIDQIAGQMAGHARQLDCGCAVGRSCYWSRYTLLNIIFYLLFVY